MQGMKNCDIIVASLSFTATLKPRCLKSWNDNEEAAITLQFFHASRDLYRQMTLQSYWNKQRERKIPIINYLVAMSEYHMVSCLTHYCREENTPPKLGVYTPVRWKQVTVLLSTLEAATLPTSMLSDVFKWTSFSDVVAKSLMLCFWMSSCSSIKKKGRSTTNLYKQGEWAKHEGTLVHHGSG